MSSTNCWEFKNCGRQPGGAKVEELGECPAGTATKTDGMNSGKNGGRVCWAVAGTLCGGKVQGSYVSKLTNCTQCDFYKLVSSEEGENYQKSTAILAVLK